MTDYTPDVVGLLVEEAYKLLEESGKKVIYKSTAPKELAVEQLRVIRQKNNGSDITELILTGDTIILKGGGDGGL